MRKYIHVERQGNNMAHTDLDLKDCLEYNVQANFVYEDIKEILANVPGEADGPEWHWIVQLKDNKFFLIEGNCDYSGWA